MDQRRSRFAKLLIVLVTAVLCLSSPAFAILAEVTIAELVQMSDHIVQATVLSTESTWNDDKTSIITTVTLHIKETYAGRLDKSTQVTVMLPGGMVDGLVMEVEHAPVFIVDEEVIVFLTDINDKALRVSGWEAGKFTLENDLIVENGIPSAQLIQQVEVAVKAAGKQ